MDDGVNTVSAMDRFGLIIKLQNDDSGLKRHSLSTSHTERCRNSVPTCLLPSQHGGEDARTLAQVGVCFSQLGEETNEANVLISIFIQQLNTVQGCK